MKILRIYTGADGESHFEDIEIPLVDRGMIGAISELQDATGIAFRQTCGDYDSDFHNAPRRQYVIHLDAAVERSRRALRWYVASVSFVTSVRLCLDAQI